MVRALILAMALTASIAAHAGWFSYDNYDECMLGKMKGQAQSMWLNAHKACAREFKVEENITSSGVKFEWSIERRLIKVDVKENDSEYRVTRARFIFADKLCADAKKADFGEPVTLSFSGRVGTTPSLAQDYGCMHIERVWGVYK